jgi:peptidoglycan-associated lipoprotein
MNPIRLAARVLPLAVAASALALAGCHSNPPKTTEKAAPSSASSAPAERVVPPPAPPDTARDASADIASQDIRALNEKGYLKPAFFDYDRADLRDDARTTLASDADLLKRYPSFQFVIEGHCDDRGTEAYNLALGERRAAAAREYLSSMGIDTTRMKTVSYGKEKPFCQQDNDSCWQSNRRDHLLITAK